MGDCGRLDGLPVRRSWATIVRVASSSVLCISWASFVSRLMRRRLEWITRTTVETRTRKISRWLMVSPSRRRRSNRPLARPRRLRALRHKNSQTLQKENKEKNVLLAYTQQQQQQQQSAARLQKSLTTQERGGAAVWYVGLVGKDGMDNRWRMTI